MSKIALITGGTSGLGEAVALELSNQGFTVYAVGRKSKNNSEDSNIHYLHVDVTNDNTIKEAVDLIESKHSKIDILINNAGIGIAGAIEEFSISKVQEAFDVNLFGVLRVTKAVVPVMREKGGGLIINISSLAGRFGLPFQGIYSSTKFALEGMTEALRMELRPFGIRVCLIEPGDYKTNVHLNRRLIIPGQESPYQARLRGFFGFLNQNIEKGTDPQKFGKLIVRISRRKKPRLRYKSGRLFEVITPAIHTILPNKLFEKILCKFYNL